MANIVPDIYRGTTVYDKARELLVQAARHSAFVEFRDIASIMDIEPIGDYFSSKIGHLLGAINEDEHNADRPMLGAIAISSRNEPGSGFYDLARKLGKSVVSEMVFWQQEIKAVHDCWSETT